jgi:signal transduction histidine kinase
VSILISFALFVSAALAIWVAMLVQRRPHARAAGPFLWLVAAIAWWCVAGAFHALAGTAASKVLWAKIQYVGIAGVGPLWLLFSTAYAGVPWFMSTGRRVALWTIPIATVLMAATNEWHRAVWPSVSVDAGGVATYAHGWWFWIAASFNYIAVLAGTVLVARELRRSPPPFRAQFHVLMAAALLPLCGNLVYVTGRSLPGLDPTPLAFVTSSLLFTWALFRHHLFDLVPVAREMVVDSLSDAVIVLDTSRRVLDMNASARELAPVVRDWAGQPVEQVLTFLQPYAIVLEAQTSTLTVSDEERAVHYDVRLMPVYTRTRELKAWVMLLRDITEQRRAAAERDALTARVQEQQQRESLSVLAGGLAHDFNNLLAGIVGNADLLSLKLAPSSEMGNNVGAILLGAQRAADLVDKMLAYAGERHGSMSRLDLDDLVRDLLDLLRASAARHCTLHYEGTPAFIDADPTQVRQVAMNLIINAAEAVDEGVGLVRVRIGIERLSARQLTEMQATPDATPGTFAYFEVRDNGHGMDKDTMQRIFQPFFTTKHSGHGLGLPAVQGILRGHRGAIRVDSTPGFGARFCAWFPLADTAEASWLKRHAPGLTQEEGGTLAATSPVEAARRFRS